ncbi:MAG TPA: terminase small subunit [Stellaceae bacterium]|jgi:phage terminase small subunit|nr:terminase small subunit [Stellaceae bacterium]
MPAKHPRRAPTGRIERERRFVAEYVRVPNGRQAAIRAGYAPVRAATQAARLLAKPAVAAAVEEANAKRAEKKRITADRVMEELGRMAFSNMGDYVTWGPNGMELRDYALLDEDQTAAIADIEPKGNGKQARLKLYDKLAALNALARHLGMIGGKTALAPRDDSEERKAANAELRERLMRIVKSGEKK